MDVWAEVLGEFSCLNQSMLWFLEIQVLIDSFINSFIYCLKFYLSFSNFVFRFLVFRRSGVPAFRRSGVPAFRRSGVPAFRRSGVPAFRHSGVLCFSTSPLDRR